MGVPKQKWTPEEEAALKDGIAKYGVGKWSTILKDLAFGPILHSRSNVDLKDKYRNLNVAASGCGSRHRVKLSLKSTPKASKHDDKAIITTVEGDINVVDTTPLAIVCGSPDDSEPDCTKKPLPRLDNLILDAIAKLKEPRGSSRSAIFTYIEEKHITPPNLENLLAASLQLMMEKGNLIKVKHRYRIAPPTTELVLKTDTSKSALEEKQEKTPKLDSNGTKVTNRSQVDADLEEMKRMTAREAAAAAALAVAEAEAAIAEAEVAAIEAEKAEAEAEARQLELAALSALNKHSVFERYEGQ